MVDLGTRTAKMWEFVEFDLSNSSYNGNPFDLGTDSKVTFRHLPSGETRTTRMFYDGSNRWSFRFTGDLAGKWQFETNSPDKDLDDFTGTINVRKNDNPDIDGFLTTQGNKFAIMGDDKNDLDGYLLSVYMNQRQQLTQGEFESFDFRTRTDDYLRDARSAGSEVIYIALNNNVFQLGAETDRAHNSKNPDLETFRRLDAAITTAHKLGGRVHFWMWGDAERGWIPEDGAGSVADERVQSYIAARLGPLPGWTAGYAFDTQEWTTASQVNDWAQNIRRESGWDHLLFARGYRNSGGPDIVGSDSRWTATQLDGHSYSSKGDKQQGLQTSPVAPNSIEEVIADINSDKNDVHFYEERFTRNRDRVGSTRGEQLTDAKTVDLQWWTAMAGGVGNWYGYFDNTGAKGPVYSNRDALRTHYTFWHEKERFTLDLKQANNKADSDDTHILRNQDRYIVYAEDRDRVQIDLNDIKGNGARVIAVDTEKGYQERNLGTIAEGNNRQIKLPYQSDWALVLEGGTFNNPGSGGSSGSGGSGGSVAPPPKQPDPVDSGSGNSDRDPLLYWKFDERSGTVAQDSSPANRDGQMRGIQRVNGLVGSGAARFDGGSDRIEDLDAEDYLTGMDAITVSMWVSSDVTNVDNGIFTTDGSSGRDSLLGMRYDSQGYFGKGRNVVKVGLQTDRGRIEYESASNVQTTDRQHLTMSWRSGSGIKLYVDGKLDRATKASGSLGGRIANIEEFAVGVGSKRGRTWDGEIDDVLIFDRQLSASEVSAIYNGNYNSVL